MSKQLILCNCLGTQTLDAEALETATGLPCSKVHDNLCMGQMGVAAEAMQNEDAVICCQQERRRFEELADDLGLEHPAFLDLRDRAGWSADMAAKLPKMSALVAEAKLPSPQVKSLDIASEGLCLIFGEDEAALSLARQIAGQLNVTVLLSDPESLPLDRGFDVVVGRLRRVEGALGGFSLTIDALRELIPGGRGPFGLTEPKDGGKSACDILIDLSRDAPMVSAPQKREGYLRADPHSPRAVMDVALEAVQLVGTFEKPLYVKLEPHLCAHSRANQPACSNCLDICPTGAITSAGEHVAVDPMICAGCGSCSAVCPSGAISYDAPPVSETFRRMQVMSEAYRGAGGKAPRLLIVDEAHGLEMIRLAARFGRGLPADVIPLEIEALAGFGHAEMLGALGCGFASVDVLLNPRTERDAPDRELALAEAIAGPGKLRLLDLTDPDALSEILFASEVPGAVDTPMLPLGTRRQIARLAARTLRPEDSKIDLPENAPYGAVLVDQDACTLCLSCVSLCPSGALGDNPDKPQLLFQEDACLQCGLCENACPEDAITLQPRMDLTDEALSQRVLNEEEPFACIECGALFGVKSTIERITERLAGKHSMFATSDAAKTIQMCDDCRVRAQFRATDNPFAGGERPRPRTSDDYFSRRRDH
ncbi:4Fe-4S dicluster domain-containing protein [Poseidonocella pacifica]|uniref:4Fe-4S dicluster domain-containing protein n=1 Tax=Poseidonocella pacifica TaxID=871651 RepID=A0A1I0WSY4_9RHOB|nr:4Fe-4S binding protein [Poseidonocella pacifica]SFA91288.1 4Fe-4S dicluster domain-containing protein [Poseidonocella pacifica]